MSLKPTSTGRAYLDHAEGKRREEDMHKEGQKLGKGYRLVTPFLQAIQKEGPPPHVGFS